MDRGPTAFGDAVEVHFETTTARLSQAWEVGSQTIAEVHHRIGAGVLCEPSPLGEAWDKIQMVTRLRASEDTCDKNRIPGFSTRAEQEVFFLNRPGEGH